MEVIEATESDPSDWSRTRVGGVGDQSTSALIGIINPHWPRPLSSEERRRYPKIMAEE